MQGGRLNHSHSAAETLDLCQRKWWYGYVARLETPSSPAAEFGSVCHQILEDMCHAGAEWEDVARRAQEETPNHWRVLKATFPNLPWVRLEGFQPWPMPPHWNSETRIDVDAHGLPFKGFIDLWTYHLIPAIDPDRKSLVISDLKVSGNPERWGKDADQLARFGQPLKYGYGICKQLDIDVDVVYAEHIYAKRTGRAKSFVVNARTGDRLGIPWESVENHWHTTVAKDTESMLRLHKVEDPEQVPANERACGAFGGCEYASICPNHPDNFIPFKSPPRAADRPRPSSLRNNGENVSNNALNALAGLAGRGPAVKKAGVKKAVAKAEKTMTVPPAAKAFMESEATGEAAEPQGFPDLVLAHLEQNGTLCFNDVKALYTEFNSPKRVRFFSKHMDSLAKTLALRGVAVEGTGKATLLRAEPAPEPTKLPAEKIQEMLDAPQPPTFPQVTKLLEEMAAAPEPTKLSAEKIREILDAPQPPTFAQVTKPAPAPTTGCSCVVYVGCYPAWKKVQHIDELLAPVYEQVEREQDITYWRADRYGAGVKAVIAHLGRATKNMVESQAPVMTQDLFIPRDHPLSEAYVGILRRYGFKRVVMG